jgi:hypothetical protein
MPTETFGTPPSVAYLQQVGAEIQTLPTDTALFRIHPMSSTHWIHWHAFRSYGPTDSRFDHHDPPPREQARKIMCVATDGPTCLAEYFQLSRRINRALKSPWLATFHTATPLALLDLTGSWPTRAGGSQEINTGDHPTCRAWSRAIYASYPEVDGLYYRSKMLGGRFSIVLYERAVRGIPSVPTFHYPLTHDDDAFQKTITNAARAMGYDII